MGLGGYAWPSADSTRVPYWVYTDPGALPRGASASSAGRRGATSRSRPRSRQPGDFMRSTVRRGPGRPDPRPARRAPRARQPLRPPGRAVLPRGGGQRDPVHLPVPPVDLRPRRPAARRAVQEGRRRPRRHAGGLRQRASTASSACAVTERHGVVFASLRPDRRRRSRTTSAPTNARLVRPGLRRAAAARCSATSASVVPANWKLMFENIKDPYHASLLHVFLVTFGLFRADNPSATADGRDRPALRARLAAGRAAGERRPPPRCSSFRARPRAARPAPARPGAGVPRRRDRGDADDLAEPHRAAAVEHAGDAPARARAARARSSCTGRSSATPTTTRR